MGSNKLKFVGLLGDFLMKKRVLVVLLTASSVIVACKPHEKSNQNISTNVIQNRIQPSADEIELKKKVEAKLKNEGFLNLTLDLSTNPPTLHGKIAPEKMAIAIMIAETAAGKKLNNGLNE